MPKVADGTSYSKKYTEDNIKKAIEAVQNGMPKKTAATKYGVPRATLQFRLSSQFVKTKPGPKTTLTDEEEKTLVNWVIYCSKRGFPRRKEDVLLSVEQFLMKNPRPNSFIDNKPGEGWYRLFLKRNPEIVSRTAEAVTAASANVSEENIRKWFTQIEEILQENRWMEVLEHPSRIFNGDETNFQLCPKNSKVLSEKGNKNVYEIDHAQAKSCLTVMFTFSADGKTTPPMVIYPLKRMSADIRASVPSHWGLGLSDNGWMNNELFLQYIQNIFHPYLTEKEIPLPVILFLDGHKSHMNYDLSEFCKQKGIILIALYPNSTRILQPADVSAFKPLKTAWKKGVLEWRRNNLTKTLTKVDFGVVLAITLEKHLKETIVKNGFKACGLYPWNPNAIDYSKCLGRSICTTDKGHSSTDNDKPEPTLTLKTFEKIIGPTVLNALQEDSSINGIERLFHTALHKVHQFLISGTVDCNERDKSNASLLIDHEWVPVDDLPIIISEDPYQDLATNNQDWLRDANVEQQSAHCQIQDRQPPDLAPYTDVPGALEEPVVVSTVINTPTNLPQSNLSAKTIADEFADTLIQSGVPELSKPSYTLGDVENTQEVSMDQTRQLCLKQTPDKKSLKDNLIWPRTPVRKGKKFNDKPVYVLTSSQWLKQEKLKLDDKQKKENEKQERKRQREEKSKNKDKSNKKNKTGESSIKENKTEEQSTKKKRTEKPNESKSREDKDDDLPLIVFKTPTKYQEETTCYTTTDIKNYVNNSNLKENRHDNKAVDKKEPVKITKICILPQIKTENKKLPKFILNESETVEKKTGFNFTVKSPKDFVLSKSKKVLERRTTFCNEQELADFLNNPESQD